MELLCNIEKFPVVLKNAISSGLFTFPDNTQYSYDAVIAYRICRRHDGDDRPVSRSDFRSYPELGKKKARSMSVEGYYGVSLFDNEVKARSIKGFPQPPCFIARGLVIDSGGPMERTPSSGHINWWMYEDADITSFSRIDL